MPPPPFRRRNTAATGRRVGGGDERKHAGAGPVELASLTVYQQFPVMSEKIEKGERRNKLPAAQGRRRPEQ